mmetsp:Transcript_96085/g.271690  ORF Transcript_96085/g.271690 Transcript_96085/m.271690 type:complete len:243 (-) Transcript_96085:369-1097(-)
MTSDIASLSPLVLWPERMQWMSCSADSCVAMPSSASFGSMRWLRSRQRSSDTASGKTSSAPMVMSHSLMRSYCARTVGGATALESAFCQALLEPCSPLTMFLGAPGRPRMQRGLSFRSLQSCSSAEPEAERCAAFRSTESPGLSFAPYVSSMTYARATVGVRQICSGVSSSRISEGMRMMSSSWQTSRVLAVPMGFEDENFVGFGRTSTASSIVNDSARWPTCSTRPTPVTPRQTPLLLSSA